MNKNKDYLLNEMCVKPSRHALVTRAIENPLDTCKHDDIQYISTFRSTEQTQNFYQHLNGLLCKFKVKNVFQTIK